ncbi:unnamed protein product [Blepharisma stoltei]|uniref:Uncharacterized protein n=1 Tax=Blepharisma stoltei TaxID=1481888 RepID=A0AAU9K9Q8_9CILI|nr:unnamed protein product [Blepharisma stoltei]
MKILSNLKGGVKLIIESPLQVHRWLLLLLTIIVPPLACSSHKPSLCYSFGQGHELPRLLMFSLSENFKTEFYHLFLARWK